MLKSKWKIPPLYMPSSGSMVSLKFSRSSGLGNWVDMVEGRESSLISRSMVSMDGDAGGGVATWGGEADGDGKRRERGDRPFCTRS